MSQRLLTAGRGTAYGKPPYAFHGGLTLDPKKRALSGDIIELGVPPVLVLPLINYAKQSLTPLVTVNQHVQRGQLLAHGIVAPTSGIVRSIEQRETIHPGALSVDCVVLDSDGLDRRESERTEKTSDDRLAACVVDFNNNDTDKLFSALNQFGIAGLGGAAFPLAEKLAAAQNGLHTLIINAAECEPEIACDEALMHSDSSNIAAGIDALVKLTQCDHCVLAIEDSKPIAIEYMEEALRHVDSSVQLMTIPTRYPAGAQSPLIQCVTGKFIPHNEHPTSHGILCINIATAHAFWQALNDQPLDSRVISLGGSAMPNPCNVRVRFGTAVSFVLENTNNGSVLQGSRIRAGGPLSGFDLNTASVPVSAKTNCILAELPVKDSPAQQCIRCGYCADVCPAKLLPQQLHWYSVASEFDQCQQLKLDACFECGCCDLVCPASIKLTETFRYAKSQISLAQMQQQKAADAEARFTIREQRVQQRELVKMAAIEKRKQSLKKARQPDAENIKAALERAKSKRGSKKT